MPSSKCTCERADGKMNVIRPDEECPAPSHLWDQIESIEEY